MGPHDLVDCSFNTGSGNGLLSDATKPLPEPISTRLQRSHEEKVNEYTNVLSHD